MIDATKALEGWVKLNTLSPNTAPLMAAAPLLSELMRISTTLERIEALLRNPPQAAPVATQTRRGR